MFKYLNKKRGQSTLEYAILIIIIIGALLSIQVYIKRGIQGRLKGAADDIGDQFSPGNTNSRITTRTISNTQETNYGGEATSELLEDEVTTTNKTLRIINTDQEYWGVSHSASGQGQIPQNPN
ncbi:MAG TPA: hypothetical protein PLH56_04690 [Candidatus Omnitrophota bacterium]|nr:hypothetical protein [Candidatus Omnitrophota bacterium]